MLSTELVRMFASIDRTSLCGRARFTSADYHRERIDCRDGFEIWLLAWLPGQATPIHDHGGAAFACEVLSGRLIEERFVARGAGVASCWTGVRGPGELDLHMTDVIHRVRALAPTISLHLVLPGVREGRAWGVAA